MASLDAMTVIALGAMADRPLARFLASFGAEIRAGTIENAAGADFLIDDLGLPALQERGWSRARIHETYPDLIHVSVTPFGSFGPGASLKGNELIASAAGGTLKLCGEPDRAPVKEALDACTFHAEMVAASGAMAAHLARIRGEGGQHIDISIQEVAFNRGVSGIVGWQFDKRKLRRVGPALNYGKATVRCIWPLADGWCFHSLMTGRFGAPANQALSDWIDEAGLPNPMRGVDWLTYNRSTLDPAVREEWEAAIEAFFRTRTKEDMAVEGRRRGVNACVVNAPSDVLMDNHLAARGFFEEKDGVKKPSRFVAIRESGTEADRRLPPATSRKGPLSGVRVLDFAWALVGSITTKTLGDLGADVIKVESRSRPCLSRIDVQVSASQPGNFDDKPWFAHLNTSKRSLSLDLKLAEAREVLNPLIEWADIVVENFSPGTMAKLGFDYESLAKKNPGIVMISGSVYGQTGPLAQEWGVDGTGGALSGRTYMTGWPDRGPVVPGAVPYGDVIVPFAMAASACALLAAREKTGRGGHVDASMYEICVQQMGDAIIAAQQGAEPSRQGNAAEGVFHQAVVAAKGDDCWLAYSAPTKDHMTKLEGVTGGLSVEAWSAERDAKISAATLQAAGIPAAPVMDMEALFADETLKARGALVELPHPHLGAFGHVRTPMTLSGGALAPYRAPGIGEHNKEIALDVAGLAPERYEQLSALGVFK